jgi:seryl-tRNA synthetase
MLDIRFLRNNIEAVRQNLKKRNHELDLDRFIAVDKRRRELLEESERLKNRRNTVSAEIARLKKAKKDCSELIEQMKEVGGRIKELDRELAGIDEEVRNFMLSVPNMLHESVPEGIDENDNITVREHGDMPEFPFEPKPHWDVGTDLGILDFERAAKITGARFVVYQGLGSRLERAIMNFMLDVHQTRHGYKEVMPPVIVNSASLKGTGQLPKFEEDLFRLDFKDYYLIPTAEVPVTNLHRDEVIPEESLPIYYAAYTPCFRSEAGAYGRDVRGIIRQHQFNKVELVKFVRPDDSYDELERLTGNAETILQLLGIPYRVIILCSGDTGFSSAKTYDIEVWLPGQKRFCEISSCSNFEDFQARRANIRYRPSGGGKSRFVHTLNGSGLAVGRTMVAILENFQQEDGSVRIPKALVPYMGGVEELRSV